MVLTRQWGQLFLASPLDRATPYAAAEIPPKTLYIYCTGRCVHSTRGNAVYSSFVIDNNILSLKCMTTFFVLPPRLPSVFRTW